jgi:hypothetical protein
MSREILGTHQKALQINLDPTSYGTFAEIGGGQEVARWFFRVGGAAGTVAKTMSAYDMTFSDAIYGQCKRYVSRQRLSTMLDHEYQLLVERLDAKRGATTRFFVFADTVAVKSFRGNNDCHGWLGIRFQVEPRGEPSDIIIHVRMLDRESVMQQEALGVMGVNLIYGALYFHQQPRTLIMSLLDNLTTERVEVDLARFSGPAFAGVDNRLMSLELVSHGLTDAAMFTADGEVVQAAEYLYKRPILVERGNFRPVTRLTLDLLANARAQFIEDAQASPEEVAVIMEMTLRSLTTSPGGIDHRDFLDRADILGALGQTVLISNYARFFRLANYLFRHTKKRIGIAIGAPALRELFSEKFYTDLEGGILESFGRLFKNDLKLYLYPMRDPQTGQLINAETFQPEPHLRPLYAYLREKKFIEDIRNYDPTCLNITSADALARLQRGDPTWETLVPPQVVQIIKERRLFGWQPPSQSAG